MLFSLSDVSPFRSFCIIIKKRFVRFVDLSIHKVVIWWFFLFWFTEKNNAKNEQKETMGDWDTLSLQKRREGGDKGRKAKRERVGYKKDLIREPQGTRPRSPPPRMPSASP